MPSTEDSEEIVAETERKLSRLNRTEQRTTKCETVFKNKRRKEEVISFLFPFLIVSSPFLLLLLL